MALFVIDAIMLNFATFKRYVLSITNNTGVIKELDEAQVEQLSYVANQFTGRAAIQAQNILCFHAGICEERVIVLPPNGLQLINSQNPTTQTGGVSAVEPRLIVIPNPNKGEFVLEVPKECKIAQLSIVDVQGKVVEFITMEQVENTSRIVILNKDSGILFLKAECNDGSIYTTRIVVNK